MVSPRNLPEFVVLRPEVADALDAGAPVVALESAVLSHGLPHPTGLETAAQLETEVRRGGAVPATVAVIDGLVIVGAAMAELERLSTAAALKVAERDLAVAVAKQGTGGTTVSATIAIAAACAIDVMSTGGLGGVHLGAEGSWDVSADLPALARHSVLVVCAGTKAICDVAKTLEYLDTVGVTVVAYGSDRFPFFYASDSGLASPQRIDTPDEAARILAARRGLAQPGAVVVAQPISEQDAMPAGLVRQAVREAVARTEEVHGRDLTPALLAALGEITQGRTLRANLALLRANAGLAARIAAAVHRNAFPHDGT